MAITFEQVENIACNLFVLLDQKLILSSNPQRVALQSSCSASILATPPRSSPRLSNSSNLKSRTSDGICHDDFGETFATHFVDRSRLVMRRSVSSLTATSQQQSTVRRSSPHPPPNYDQVCSHHRVHPSQLTPDSDPISDHGNINDGRFVSGSSSKEHLSFLQAANEKEPSSPILTRRRGKRGSIHYCQPYRLFVV